MMKAIALALPLLALAGCQTHPAQYASLDVGVANNQPCFIVPGSPASGLLTATAPTIARLEDNQWQTLTPGATWQPERMITAGVCTGWPEINWQPGVYDVAFKVSDNDHATRYATRFVLQQTHGGAMTISKQESTLSSVVNMNELRREQILTITH